MKLNIALIDSGIKKNSSKAMDTEISAMENVFRSFLSKNAHFKGVKNVSMTMTLCGKTKIKSLNKDYRQKDYATDVLSFPVYENLRPDKKSKEKCLPEMELGDLVICRDIAISQAREFNISYEQEIIHLAVHGFLHLLGFDHEISAKEEKVMEEFEGKLVNSIYKKLK